jgi:hypothetical protein
MQIIQLKQFLDLFAPKHKKYRSPTLPQFMEIATVRIGNKLEPLSEYMKRKSISAKTIDVLLTNIITRDEYLTRFYNLSLSIRLDKLQIHDSNVGPMKSRHMSNNVEILYKNFIRNIHFHDILQNTTSGIENVPTFLNVLLDLYTKFIIDYKLLTPSATFYINNGRIGSVFSSYYFRASIMNPYLVYSLNQSILHGTRIFTPTLGWSSYCYGFLECPDVVEYVGTDVIPSVCDKTRELAALYTQKRLVDIYCVPSEDLCKDRQFMKKYKEHFDVVYFSPPYFKLEMYEGKEQSTHRYSDYNEWLQKYWEETIKLCSHVLAKRGKMCYILSGYGSQSSKQQYDLLTDMNRIAKKYFVLNSTQQMYNKNVHVSDHRPTDERIMFFTKK